MISKQLLKTSLCSLAMTIGFGRLSSAQDYKAVERRLGGAIEAGEITIDQAKAMMDALRRTPRHVAKRHSAKRQGASDRDVAARKKRYLQIQRKIEAAIRAGDLSKRDAEKKLIAVRDELFPKKNVGANKKRRADELKKRYAGIQKRVEIAIKRGLISKADGWKRLAAAKKQMFGKQPAKKSDRDMAARKKRYLQIQRQIEAAVRAGNLSKRDAHKKLIAVRNQLFPKKKVEANKKRR